MKSKMNGMRPSGRPRLRWLDNIDSHLKGKNASLKEVLETKCFVNQKDWRTLISYSTDWSSGAKTIKKNTNSTQNKSQTHRAKQYEVTTFQSTVCELSTETCSKNVYSLGPWRRSLNSYMEYGEQVSIISVLIKSMEVFSIQCSSVSNSKESICAVNNLFHCGWILALEWQQSIARRVDIALTFIAN